MNESKIREIFAKIIGCEESKITSNIPLSELGLDSLRFVSAVVEFETELGIEILDSDLDPLKFETLSKATETLSKYITPVPLCKCVITDCDGVLWEGIAGEGGVDNAVITQNNLDYVNLLSGMKSKGILLAICSKNDFSNIEKPLSQTPISTRDFAIIETGVTSKSESVSYILKEFGFFEENAIFIDDSDGELEVIKTKFPGIQAIKWENGILSKLKQTAENIPESQVSDRTEQFKSQKQREKTRVSTWSAEEYNTILQTTVVCGKAEAQDIPRLSELSQRANRFNLTGAKYTEEQFSKVFENGEYSVYKLCAADKFGDMGLVAMAVVKENIIESFIMSCRVFDRSFEDVLLNEIAKNHGEVTGIYISTGKNGYCRDFYPSHGVAYELR